MTKPMKHLFAVTIFAILAFGALTPRVYAQGSRKDDIVFNAQGRPMAGATVRICTSSATGQPCTPLASIFSDAAMTQALANPLSADGLGNYTFYAAPGRYEIEISGPGITTKQLPNVILPSDPSSPTFTTVTTTSGISAFSLTLAGNLTVSGSTAVAGTLSVGGAPVPSTNADNPGDRWAALQRANSLSGFHGLHACGGVQLELYGRSSGDWNDLQRLGDIGRLDSRGFQERLRDCRDRRGAYGHDCHGVHRNGNDDPRRNAGNVRGDQRRSAPRSGRWKWIGLRGRRDRHRMLGHKFQHDNHGLAAELRDSDGYFVHVQHVRELAGHQRDRLHGCVLRGLGARDHGLNHVEVLQIAPIDAHGAA